MKARTAIYVLAVAALAAAPVTALAKSPGAGKSGNRTHVAQSQKDYQRDRLRTRDTVTDPSQDQDRLRTRDKVTDPVQDQDRLRTRDKVTDPAQDQDRLREQDRVNAPDNSQPGGPADGGQMKQKRIKAENGEENAK